LSYFEPPYFDPAYFDTGIYAGPPPRWSIKYFDGVDWLDVVASRIDNISEELKGHEEATFKVPNTALNRAFALKDYPVSIYFDNKSIYTGTLKAVEYSLTQLALTCYNQTYITLQKRSYTGSFNAQAANVVLAALTGAGGGETQNFGNTKIELGEQHCGLESKHATQFQMLAVSGAALTDLYAAIRVEPGDSAKAKMAVYSNLNDAPDALLGVSDEVTITATEQTWTQFHFSTPITMDPSILYWFAICNDSNIYYAANWNGSVQLHGNNPSVYSDGFTDPYGAITESYNLTVSFYAVISVPGAGGGECPTTVVTEKYVNANRYDAAAGLAKELKKDFWGNDFFNIGVRNSCVLCLPFEDGYGYDVTDISGHGNDASIHPAAGSFVSGTAGTGDENYACSANVKYARSYIAQSTGFLSKITARVKRNSTSGKVRCAIYTDVAGAPSVLISQTQEVTVTTTVGWVDFPFLASEQPIVYAGTSYWLAILTDEAYTVRDSSGSVTTSFTFGLTAIGDMDDGNDPDYKSLSSYVCGHTGTITKLTAYFYANPPGNVRLAIYSDNGGVPDALLGVTNEVSVGGSFSWVDFPFASPVNVTAATTYWLAICSASQLIVKCTVGVSDRLINNQGGTYAGEFTDPAGTVWGGANGMCIYATGTYSGGGGGTTSTKYAADTYSDGFANAFGTASTTANKELSMYASGYYPVTEWVTGKYGKAITFTGLTYVTVPHASNLNFTTGDFTVIYWVKLSSHGSAVHMLKGAYQVSGWYIVETGNDLLLYVNQAGAYQTVLASTLTGTTHVLEDDVWIQFAIVRSGSTGKIYKNGQDVTYYSDTLQNPASNTGDLYIGSDGAGKHCVVGIIDEVLIYNRALTAYEVGFIYNSRPRGCKRRVDRSKIHSKVVVEGVDLNGNKISGEAGTGEDVQTFTQIEPANQTSLESLAASALEILSNPSTGAPINVPITVAANFKPGDTFPVRIDYLAMSDNYRIQKIVKGETKATVTLEKTVANVEKLLNQIKAASIQQISARAGVTFTRSLSTEAPPNPEAGDNWYQTDLQIYCYYNGSSWLQYQPV
jgi:hypothetical protein